jgi:hypothetical protein
MWYEVVDWFYRNQDKVQGWAYVNTALILGLIEKVGNSLKRWDSIRFWKFIGLVVNPLLMSFLLRCCFVKLLEHSDQDNSCQCCWPKLPDVNCSLVKL